MLEKSGTETEEKRLKNIPIKAVVRVIFNANFI